MSQARIDSPGPLALPLASRSRYRTTPSCTAVPAPAMHTKIELALPVIPFGVVMGTAALWSQKTRASFVTGGSLPDPSCAVPFRLLSRTAYTVRPVVVLLLPRYTVPSAAWYMLRIELAAPVSPLRFVASRNTVTSPGLENSPSPPRSRHRNTLPSDVSYTSQPAV